MGSRDFYPKKWNHENEYHLSLGILRTLYQLAQIHTTLEEYQDAENYKNNVILFLEQYNAQEQKTLRKGLTFSIEPEYVGLLEKELFFKKELLH